MSEDLIRYDVLAQEALRGVVKKIIGEVSRTGLPGEHHFYVSFATKFPGVRLSNRMREKYPEEMTIVIQHQYWDLEAHENEFEIGLSFNDIPEKLSVPYASIKGFFDPSVQFGLQFDADDDASDNKSPPTSINAIASIGEFTAASENDETGEASKAAPSAKQKAKKKPKTKAAVEKQSGDSDAQKSSDTSKGEDQPASAEVVSLDSFRKKN